MTLSDGSTIPLRTGARAWLYRGRRRRSRLGRAKASLTLFYAAYLR